MGALKMIKQCKICDSNFEPDKWHPNQIYCSQSCNQKAYRERTGKAVKANLFRTRRFKLISELGGKCEACGIEDKYFQRYLSCCWLCNYH